MPDPDLVEMVDLEVRDLITLYQFSPEAPGIFGSAKEALEIESDDIESIGYGSIIKLLHALDNAIPNPKRATDLPFLMPIESVFSISGRGTVATGVVSQGTLKVNTNVEIVNIKPTIKTTCTGIERHHVSLPSAEAGDNVGLLLRGLKRDSVLRGQLVVQVGSVECFDNFRAKIYVLSAEEGGREKPFKSSYQPQLYIRTLDVTGTLILTDEDLDFARPGESVEVEVRLRVPIALTPGLKFTMREGQKTIGQGVVTYVPWVNKGFETQTQDI